MKPILLIFFATILAAIARDTNEHIELSKIAHFAPKGRVQDKDYNPQLPIIDTLIEQGTNSIPLLIQMLSDDTKLDHQVIDYWPSHTVGDTALVILTDLTTDSSWRTSTIPGASWDDVLGKPATNNAVIPPYYQLQNFKQKHGSAEIQKRWQKIWLKYQQQIYWDTKQRCFKLRRSQNASGKTRSLARQTP
jgi:hypothetical protein